MKWWIVFLLAIFPLGQIVRWNYPGTAVVFHLNDFVVLAVVLVGILNFRRDFWKSLTSDDLFKPILVWVLIMVVSLVVNIPRLPVSEVVAALLYSFRWVVYAGLYFVIRMVNSEDKLVARRWLIVVTVIVGLVGLAQYVFIPDVSFLAASDWDDHYFRLVSTFLDPGFTGAVLVLGLLAVFLSKNLSRMRKLFGVGLLYLTMALTYSRASYLGYLAAFGVVAWYRQSWKLLVVAALVLFVTIPILPKSVGEGTKLGRENSVEARINNWRQTVVIWLKSPVLGVGFNAYRYAQGASLESHSGAGADSSVLLVLATTGLIGLLIFCWLGFSVWKLYAGDVLVVASLAAVFVHSWFNNTLFYPWALEWVWILLAVRESI